MSRYPINTDGREDEFFERVAVCLESSGDELAKSKARLATEFPEFANQLNEYFDGRDLLEQIVAPLRESFRELADTACRSNADSAKFVHEPPQLPDYEIVEIIARGGMGVVYKAKQISLQRVVALKMIRSVEMATPADVQKFREEAQHVAQLDHPGIVPVYEIGNAGDRPYFTMRLMEGGSLSARLERGGVPVRKAAEVISQMARAVHYAHQRGILHRDIKPGNLLFDRNECCQIADFGLAKQIDREFDEGHSFAIVGTPMYMAPEQAHRKGSLTTAVDVYGLGAVLYEMLTGRPPFRAANALDTLLEVARREPTRPRTFLTNIDIDLETICLKCLEKDPDRRYGSAEALAEDLDRWLRNEPILARRSSMLRRAFKWARRSPAIASLAAFSSAAIAVLIAALFVGNAMITHETQQKSEALQKLTDALQQNNQALLDRTEALDNLNAIRTREQRLSYFQSIALAERELVAGNVERVEQILSEAPTMLRSWEWGYLHRLCHAERSSRATQAEPVSVCGTSDDGTLYVAGGVLGKPGAIEVFMPGSTSPVRRIRIHDDSVRALAISSDGTKLASVSGNIVKVSDTKTDRVLSELVGHPAPVFCVAFSPDGNVIAWAGSDGAIRLSEAITGMEISRLAGHRGEVWSLSFSPDGQTIVSGGTDNSVRTWNVRSGDLLQTYHGHLALVRSVAFSPDGLRIVSGAYDKSTRIWHVTTGKELGVLGGHTGFVTRAAFSPDNRRIATASVDGTLRVWDAESGESLFVLRGHKGAVWDLMWSRDGRQIETVGADSTVRTWEGTQNGLPRTLGQRDRWLQRLEPSASGNRLVLVYDDRTLEIWNRAEDTFQCRFGGSFENRNFFEISGDGLVLATSKWKEIESWNTDDGKRIRTIATADLRFNKLTLNSDGRIVAGEANGLIQVWDDDQLIAKFSGPKRIASLKLSADGRRLVVAGDDETDSSSYCVNWNVHTEAELARFATNGSQLMFSDDAKFLAISGKSSAVEVWNVDAGTVRLRVDRHRGIARAVAFLPEGDRLFTSDDDGVVTVWDFETGREVLALREMSSPISRLVLLEDQTLLGVNQSGSVRRWIGTPK